MHSGAAGEQGLGDGDADRSADVAHEVEEAAGIANLLVAQSAVGGGGDGDKDERQGESCNENREQQGGGGDVEVDAAEVERGEAEDSESEGEQVARVDLVGEIADDGHAADGADAAGRDHQAGSEGSVAEQLLIEERQDDDGGVDGDAEQEDERAADSEVAVLKQLEIDHGLVLAPGVPEEDGEAGDEEEEGPANPEGAEPVVLLAFIENDLEQAGPDDERAEAEVVEGGDFGVLDVGRVVDEPVDHEQREDADRDVDVEGVAPGVGVGEPAAEGGAEDGRDADSEGEDGHGCAAFDRREGLEQDGLRERLQGSAARALNHAGDEEEDERGGGPAGEAGDGEDGYAGHEEALAAETQRAPVAGGEDDGVGDQVAGEHPGG